MKLFHNTTLSNLANIIRMGYLTVNNPHKEGHGDMLWFTTSDDYGSEVKTSIEVPEEEFNSGKFEFVNKIHVVTLQNIPIKEYNFQIEAFSPIYFDKFGAYVGFNKERINRLISNNPNGVLEEEAFALFNEKYKDNKDMQTVLSYIKENQSLMESKKGKTIYLTEEQIKYIIEKTLKNHG